MKFVIKWTVRRSDLAREDRDKLRWALLSFMDRPEANIESIVLFGAEEGAAILEGTDVIPLLKEAWDFSSEDEHLVDLDVEPTRRLRGLRFRSGGHDIAVTASLGAAAFPADAKDGVELLSRADLAMYRVKEHGGDRTSASTTREVSTADLLKVSAD